MNTSIFYTHGFLTKYVTAYVCFCLFAFILAVWRRQSLLSDVPNYRRFLAVRWKLLTFLPAFLFVAFAGRLTDDPTWDVICGGGMAALTFATAPWAIGTLFKVVCGKRPLAHGVIAVALWLFASSWFYDGYLFLRDGRYSDYWLGNLLISPFIYLAAGLFWNLEARLGGGMRLAFLRPDWPAPPQDRRFWPVIAIALPLAAVAVYLLVAYVEWPALKPLTHMLGLK